jgi:hypothetical protein
VWPVSRDVHPPQRLAVPAAHQQRMQQLIIQRRCCHTLLITLLLQPLPHIRH